MSSNSGDISTVSDSGSNTYVIREKNITTGTSSSLISIVADCLNITTGGALTVKITTVNGSASNDIIARAQEWDDLTGFDSGINTPVFATNAASPQTATLQATSGANTRLIVCGCPDVPTDTAGLSDPPTSGYTSLGVCQQGNTYTAGGFAYKDLSASGSQSVTWSWTGGNLSSTLQSPIVAAAYGRKLTAPIGPSLAGKQIYIMP